MTEQADVIVVGSTQHGPLRRVLLGSVGKRLLSGAPVLSRWRNAATPRAGGARSARSRSRSTAHPRVTDRAARGSRPGDPGGRLAAGADGDRASRRDAGTLRPFGGSRAIGHDRTRRGAPAPGARRGPHSPPHWTISAMAPRLSRRCWSVPSRQPRSSTWPTPTSPCSCSARALTGRCGARWSAASRLRSSGTHDAQCSSRRTPTSIPLTEALSRGRLRSRLRPSAPIAAGVPPHARAACPRGSGRPRHGGPRGFR